jgi:Ca2+-binding EF-hand superfamily protein
VKLGLIFVIGFGILFDGGSALPRKRRESDSNGCWLLNLFLKFDANEDQQVTLGEMSPFFVEEGMGNGKQMTRKDVAEYFPRYDADKSESLSLKEFVAFYTT